MRPLDPRLLPHLRPARSALALSTAASALGGLLLVAQAVVVGSLVAELVRGSGTSAWTEWVPWLVAVFAGRALCGYVADTASARASDQVVEALRQRLLDRGLASPELVRGTRLGELSTLTTRGLNAVDPYLTRYLPALGLAVVLPVVSVLAIAWLDLLSAVIVVATLPLVPIFAILVGLQTRDRADRQWRSLAGLAGHFLDVVTGLPTLVAHRRARAQAASIRSITERYRRASMDTLRVAFASSAVLELVATLSVALVAVAVGLRLAGGSLDLRTALIVLLLAPEAYWPIRRVGAEFHAAAEGTATFERASELLGPEKSGPVSTPRPDLGLLRPPDLAFRHLSVRHPGSAHPTLVDFSAHAPAGALTVIAGPSGSGKSTLLAALVGELPLEHGSILAGGIQLDSVSASSWHGTLAQAPQRPWLTAGSIRDNLRVAHPTCEEAHLWAALEQVAMGHVVASLPDGLETPLGEDGAGLSAGQQARLSLARILLAVLHGRSLVVLDEPTAHLDADTERILIDTLRSLAGRATVIAVAHSPALLDAADHVIALPAPAPQPVVRTRESRQPEPTSASRTVDSPGAAIPPPRFGLRTGIALGVLASSSGVALTATAGWLIAKAAEHPPVLHLMVAIVGVRLFGLARPVLRYAERLVSHDAAMRLLADRRAAVYDGLVPLVPGALGRRRGDLLATLVDDVDSELDHHLRVRLPVATAVGVTLIAAATALVIQSPAAAVLTLVFALAAGMPAWLLARGGGRRSEAAFLAARTRLWEEVTTLLQDARQLVLWQVDRTARARVSDADHTLARSRTAGIRMAAAGRSWVLMASGLGVLAMAGLVTGSSISPAMQALLVLVPLALAEVLVPLADAGTLSVRTDRARARLEALLGATPAVTDPVAPAVPGPGRELVADDLGVGWDRLAANGIDLALAPGRRIAVVGPSGCGKSTLAATLVRFIDPLRGAVTLDGVDTRRLLLDDLRGRVGHLDDDPHLFSTSLVENVRLARPDASDAEVRNAMDRAHLGAWIAGLPEGLDTMIGDGHASVSGGERARIGLARTLLAGQHIVVLDEPTAHLDAATAHAVATEVLTGDQAVVWITHGTAGLDLVDEVVSLGAPAAVRLPAPQG